jgi:uncharacterized protein (TIGR03546 family)
MLKFIIRFLKAINSNQHPGEIAHAVCLGMILGFMPKTNALWYILTVFFLFMRINKGTLALSTVLFSLLAPALDPLFDTIGWWFLTQEKLAPAFTWLLDIPFVGFTKFNNTIVSGSLLFSLICYIPVYFISRLIIKLWRTKISYALRKTKLIIFLSKLPLIKKIGAMV